MFHLNKNYKAIFVGEVTFEKEKFAALVRHHSFVEIDHEIFSMVILSLPLIQEGKLSVTCERMCTEYWLTAQ